jgi:hypothetical protein
MEVMPPYLYLYLGTFRKNQGRTAEERLSGCPTTHRMPATVILSKAKNLIFSGTYTFEFLRLTPQNDVVGILFPIL